MKDKEKQIWQDVANVMCDCEDKENFTERYRTKCRGCNMLGVIRHIVFFLNNSEYRKLPEESVLLSREEYENIYEQAEQNVLANIADGGTSCHWCIEQHEKKASKETAEKFANRLIEIFSTAMGVCSGCALQHDKAKNPTAREFQFGKYKGLEVAIKEVKELAKREGVEIKE